ncbi:hypothetical protein EEL30_27275 [Brevibacillus laterosporus]|uniref:Uncharacterized protein n=1 Tax=Brevibacillus laterosporus TaxID=1465 RepID=A0A518VF72_BRELA|nr:hypothetical protein EEL30_27275 [Brevibacillus laterosporus]
MDNLVELMNKTDKVRLTAPGTDLSFSIKDIPAIKCAGECNIPDGEIFTAPVRDSVMVPFPITRHLHTKALHLKM